MQLRLWTPVQTTSLLRSLPVCLVFLITTERQTVITQDSFFFFLLPKWEGYLRLTVAHYVMESLRKLTFALLLGDLRAAVGAPSPACPRVPARRWRWPGCGAGSCRGSHVPRCRLQLRQHAGGWAGLSGKKGLFQAGCCSSHFVR